MLGLLQGLIVLLTIGVIAYAIVAATTDKTGAFSESNPVSAAIGGVLGFFGGFLDTLGGAPDGAMLSIFKFTNLIKDRKLPGTLVIGSTLIAGFEFLIFTSSVYCDETTTWMLLIAVAIGAVVGSIIMTKVPHNVLCIFMGIGLVITAFVIVQKNLGAGPFSNVGYYSSLYGGQLILGAIVFVILGMLSSFGVPIYSLAMAVLLMCDCDAGECFPIIMGAAAISRLAGSFPYIAKKQFDLFGAIGIGAGGIIGVFLAWKVITSFPMFWLIFIMALICVAGAIMFFISSSKNEAIQTNSLLEGANEQSSNRITQKNVEAVPAGSLVSATDIDESVGKVMEYKKLLDAGIINQEQYEAKRKELLGL